MFDVEYARLIPYKIFMKNYMRLNKKNVNLKRYRQLVTDWIFNPQQTTTEEKALTSCQKLGSTYKKR
jgi:hypothetical protein